MKVLNEVRRDALAQLRETLLENGRREPAKKKAEKGNKKTVANEREDNLPLYVSCERTELAEALKNCFNKRICRRNQSDHKGIRYCLDF